MTGVQYKGWAWGANEVRPGTRMEGHARRGQAHRMLMHPRPGPLLLTWIIPVWISNYIQYQMCGEITYPFPNFNGTTVEVSEWIGHFHGEGVIL